MLKAEGEADDAALRLVLHEGLIACPTSKALMVALLEFEAERGGMLVIVLTADRVTDRGKQWR